MSRMRTLWADTEFLKATHNMQPQGAAVVAPGDSSQAPAGPASTTGAAAADDAAAEATEPLVAKTDPVAAAIAQGHGDVAMAGPTTQRGIPAPRPPGPGDTIPDARPPTTQPGMPATRPPATPGSTTQPGMPATRPPARPSSTTQPGNPPPPPRPPATPPPAASPPGQTVPKGVDINEAFEVMASADNWLVVEAGDHASYERFWEEAGGKPPAPKLAFRWGKKGRIRIDLQKLNESQTKRFVELDKARDPNSYPEDGGGEGGGPGDGGGSKGAGAKESPEALENRANAYPAKAETYKQKVDAFAKTEPAMKAEQAAAERAALQAEQKALAQEGEALSQSLPKGSATAAKVMGALTLVLGTAYILQGTSATDVLKRTGEVEVNLGEAALFNLIAKSNVVTGFAVALLQLSSDQGSPSQAQREKQWQLQREQNILEATANFLHEQYPDKWPAWGGTPVIVDQKLWDAALAAMRKYVWQKEQEAFAAQLNAKKIHAHNLGVQDGMAGERNQKDDAVPESQSAAGVPYELEINTAYETGFKEGAAVAEKAKNRARDAGAADRKAGKGPQQLPAIENSAEFEFMNQRLLKAYFEGYGTDN